MIGCAGSFPGPASPASSYLVQADDVDGRTWNVLLDLGNGALGPLQQHCAPADVDAVCLSHLHPDHMADLSSLYVYLRYHPDPGSRRCVDVHGPVGTVDRLGQAYGLEPGESMAEHLRVHTWQPGQAVQVGPVRVTPVAVEHPVPAFGVRVEGPAEDDPTRTVTLAYSGDTDACAGLDELAAGADVLLAEAAFVEGRDDGVRGIHLTGRRAGQAAARGRVGRLVLTHIPAWNDPAAAVAEAREVHDGPIEVASPGMVLAL